MVMITAPKAPKKTQKVLVEKTICAKLKVQVSANDDDETKVTILLGENSKNRAIDVTKYFVADGDYTQVADEYLQNIIAGLVDECYGEFGDDDDEDGRYCTREAEKEDDDVVVELKVLVNPRKKRIYFFVGHRKQLLDVAKYLHEDTVGDLWCEFEDNITSKYKIAFHELDNFNLSEQERKELQGLQNEIDTAYNAYNAVVSDVVSQWINQYSTYGKLVDRYQNAIHELITTQK